MKNERGFTLVELLVTSFLVGVVLLGVSALYVATTRAFDESSSQAALQRQGTLVMEELARQVRSATAITTTTCNGHAGSLQVTTAGVTHCYYVGTNGELCQYSASTCRNLLAGSLRPRVPGSQAQLTANPTSFTATPVGTNRADIDFRISDGMNASMEFKVSLTCVGRTC
ncbi:MAG: PilW family protein [Candidatus Methylomirabilis sp.]